MNHDRRKTIDSLRSEVEALIQRLSGTVADVESVSEEEQEYLDNMPEAFQTGEKGDAAEAAITALSEAAEGIESAISGLDEAASALETAVE